MSCASWPHSGYRWVEHEHLSTQNFLFRGEGAEKRGDRGSENNSRELLEGNHWKSPTPKADLLKAGSTLSSDLKPEVSQDLLQPGVEKLPGWEHSLPG